MIYATYQLLNEGVPTGKPITKNFKSVEEQHEWEMAQMSHPFLSYKLLNAIQPGIQPTIV